ncbi:MAG: YicC family protein [Bacteroidales bacterium]|nr:YicC family protein [Bacteroidales bacterium]
MIKSMTGYGRSVAELPGKQITIEIKSLNSKGFDLNVKIPPWFREKELEFRNMLSFLQRGKIDLFILSEATGDELPYSLNKSLAHRYFEALKELQHEFNEENPEGLLPLVVRMPDILQSDREEIDPAQWEVIRLKLEEALREVEKFREKEGMVHQEEMIKRIMAILALLNDIEPLDAERKEMVRSNLQKALDQFLATNGAARADSNRFEQELIYYLEKMDFTEERVRLKKHCDYFLETLNDTESQGKKLSFICQEIGREINTLGSKASHAGIQKIVVQMKDELEKVKEQLLNIL